MAHVNEGLHSFTCHLHAPLQVEWTIPAFLPSRRTSPHIGWVLIFRPAEGRRLSWHEWLVTNRGGLPARRRSPIPVGLLTGPGVEKLRWSRPMRYHQTKPPHKN